MCSLLEQNGFKFVTVSSGMSQTEIIYNMHIDNVTANFP
jgi:hypothetical protein